MTASTAPYINDASTFSDIGSSSSSYYRRFTRTAGFEEKRKTTQTISNDECSVTSQRRCTENELELSLSELKRISEFDLGWDGHLGQPVTKNNLGVAETFILSVFSSLGKLNLTQSKCLAIEPIADGTIAVEVTYQNKKLAITFDVDNGSVCYQEDTARAIEIDDHPFNPQADMEEKLDWLFK
ncbi:MAG: hypothetical protein AB8G05_06295 [Oligoflexales bacterium]